MNEIILILYRWFLAKYTTMKSFTSWKVSANLCNFRIPVYKVVPLPWMKWNPSFDDKYCKSVRLKSFTFWMHYNLCKQGLNLRIFGTIDILVFRPYIWLSSYIIPWSMFINAMYLFMKQMTFILWQWLESTRISEYISQYLRWWLPNFRMAVFIYHKINVINDHQEKCFGDFC